MIVDWRIDMWNMEDTTYNDIRRRSLDQWLDEMSAHEDLTVRGGVKLAREYMAHLEAKVAKLEQENELKNEYLKKLKGKK